MLPRIFEITFYTSLGVIAIPSVVLALNFKRLTPHFRWLAYVLWFSLICDLSAELLYRLGGSVNVASATYGILNTAFISAFFYHAIGKRKLLSAIVVVNVFCLVFFVLNFTLLQKVTINSYSFALEKLVIMALSVTYYYTLLKELPAEKVHRITLFRIVSIIFIINSAKLVIYSFVTYLVSSFQDNLLLLFTIHNGMSIIQSAVIGWALLSDDSWRTRRT